MKSILLVVQAPPTGDDEKLKRWWKLSQTAAGAAKTNKGYDMLNAGTFLIHASDGLSFLSHALRQAEEDGFQYRVLFLEESSELPKLNS